MIHYKKVTFSYPDHSFYFDTKITPGLIHGVLGPSGCGKSTFLSLLCGFVKPTSGHIYFANNNITELPPSKRPVTILFQENNLFEHLSVKENIALGIHPGLKLTKEDNLKIDQILHYLDLYHKKYNYPHELSGGQKSRVAIARCLVRNKPILLLDEPFSALDPGLTHEILELIKSVKRKLNLTVLIVSHSTEEIKKICDNVIFIESGSIIEQATIENFFTGPKKQHVKNYLGNTI